MTAFGIENTKCYFNDANLSLSRQHLLPLCHFHFWCSFHVCSFYTRSYSSSAFVPSLSLILTPFLFSHTLIPSTLTAEHYGTNLTHFHSHTACHLLQTDLEEQKYNRQIVHLKSQNSVILNAVSNFHSSHFYIISCLKNKSPLRGSREV